MSDIMKPLGYTIAQTQKVLTVSRSTINNLIRDGKLKTKRIGRRVLVTAESVETFWAGA